MCKENKSFVGEISSLPTLRPKTTGFGGAGCGWSSFNSDVAKTMMSSEEAQGVDFPPKSKFKSWTKLGSTCGTPRNKENIGNPELKESIAEFNQ